MNSTFWVAIAFVAALLTLAWAFRRNGRNQVEQDRRRSPAEREEAREARMERRRQLGQDDDEEEAAVKVDEHLRNARRLGREMRAAGEELRTEVVSARRNGASWREIAEAVGEAPLRPVGASATAMQRFYEERS